jgi:hypothetical protein
VAPVRTEHNKVSQVPVSVVHFVVVSHCIHPLSG